MSDRITTNTEPSVANTPRLSSSLAPAAAVAALVNSFVLTGAAFAQEKTVVDLDKLSVEGTTEKPVSSPKFPAPLVDTPQTVSVITSEIFNQQGAASLADVLSNTPGITFLAGEGGHVSGSNSIMMRGFDATSSIFIHGVRDNGSYSRDIYNVEQVEVVKGPSGDTGRGSAGGYLNLSTKQPRLENFQNWLLSYGTDEYASIDRKRVTLDVNQSMPSEGEGYAIRVNALWQDGGVAGRDYTVGSWSRPKPMWSWDDGWDDLPIFFWHFAPHLSFQSHAGSEVSAVYLYNRPFEKTFRRPMSEVVPYLRPESAKRGGEKWVGFQQTHAGTISRRAWRAALEQRVRAYVNYLFHALG